MAAQPNVRKICFDAETIKNCGIPFNKAIEYHLSLHPEANLMIPTLRDTVATYVMRTPESIRLSSVPLGELPESLICYLRTPRGKCEVCNKPYQGGTTYLIFDKAINSLVRCDLCGVGCKVILDEIMSKKARKATAEAGKYVYNVCLACCRDHVLECVDDDDDVHYHVSIYPLFLVVGVYVSVCSSICDENEHDDEYAHSVSSVTLLFVTWIYTQGNNECKSLVSLRTRRRARRATSSHHQSNPSSSPRTIFPRVIFVFRSILLLFIRYCYSDGDSGDVA